MLSVWRGFGAAGGLVMLATLRFPVIEGGGGFMTVGGAGGGLNAGVDTGGGEKGFLGSAMGCSGAGAIRSTLFESWDLSTRL